MRVVLQPYLHHLPISIWVDLHLFFQLQPLEPPDLLITVPRSTRTQKLMPITLVIKMQIIHSNLVSDFNIPCGNLLEFGESGVSGADSIGIAGVIGEAVESVQDAMVSIFYGVCGVEGVFF